MNGCIFKPIKSKWMVRLIMIGASLLLYPNNLFSINANNEYRNHSTWKGYDSNGNTIIEGEITTNIKILYIFEDKLKIKIHKYITPFSQVLEFETVLILINNTYVLKDNDNFGNSVIGYLNIEGDNIRFYLDCTNYSEYGKNLGRMFGETIILTKIRE